MVRNILRSLIVITTLLLPFHAFAAKDFKQYGLESDILRLEASLAKEAAPNEGKTAQQLQAEARKIMTSDQRQAIALASQAVLKAENDPTAWLLLSNLFSTLKSKNWNENYQSKTRAKAAAYKSYLVASSPQLEAKALAALGALYADDEYWRPALDSYAASLKAFEQEDIRDIYEILLDEHGFNYRQYTVNLDSPTPRICFQFSENLVRNGVDYSSFVATPDAKNLAFFIEDGGTDLCVEGIQHGKSYNFTLREGLPSNVGEKLRRSVDLQITVDNRSPQVRVIGRTYVLPTTGQDGLPLTSVNTKQLDLEVYRIGDRNIVPTVRSDIFLERMSESYSLRDVRLNKGVKVWTGTLDTQSDLNKEVITTFPVAEALGKLEPGVYLLTAEPHKDKKDPSEASSDEDGDSEYDSSSSTKATQWFVISDLGLTVFKGKDGIHVLARSLSSAAPIANAEARLLAHNNDILGTKTLDAQGHAVFAPGLSRGEGTLEPRLIVVSTASDYNFIDLKQSSFDLSDRGVKGRPAPNSVDAYVFAERGVYRPNETIKVTSLLRDARGQALEKIPLTIVVTRPDGVEFRRQQVQDQAMGGRVLEVALPTDAARGTWRIAAYTDPKQSAIGSTSVLVEDYVSERLELTLSPNQAQLRPTATASIALNARYLFGAPGSDLAISGDLTIKPSDESPFPVLQGYSVGLESETFEVVNEQIETEVRTDDKGNAIVEFAVPDIKTPKPGKATISLSVTEDGGRAVTRSLTLPVLPQGPVIGIKSKLTTVTDEREGQTARFDALVVDANGKMLPTSRVVWTLSRINRSYQWFNSEGRWDYTPVETKTKIADGVTSTDGKVPASISATISWGTYRLDMSAPDLGPTAQSSIRFTSGYSGEQTSDTPDRLEVTIDKASYASGDTMQVQLSPRFNGKATIAIISDKVYDLQTVDVSKKGTLVKIPVKAEWGSGAYLVAFAHRPLDVAAKRLPGRALGLTWFSVDKDQRKLDIKINAPETTLSARSIDIPVQVSGLKAGEEAYVTLAAVDVGILNLTRYESPDPTSYFFGQKQLSAEIIDLYGFLIDGMQGTRGAYRSGGDALPSGFEALPPTEEPLTLFSGIVKVGPDGVAKVTLPLPAFNGKGRLMAVAWSKDRVGSASTDMVIRDPVVTLVTLPRFLAIGDQTELFLQINNVNGQTGEYVVEFDIDGSIKATAKDLHQPLKLAKGEKATISIPLTAIGNGTAKIGMSLRGPNGISVERTYRLGIVPGTVSATNRMVREIKSGESLSLSNDLLANIVPGTGAVTVSISTASDIDVPGLLKGLDRYPYGCSEQLTSRALPLLYLNELAAQELMPAEEGTEKRISSVIERLLARQNAQGSFGMWSADSSSNIWLDAFVTDFLTRAREAKYDVPEKAFNRAMEHLRNVTANTTNVEQNGSEIAYSAYVLARNGRPVIGDLRYLSEAKLNAFKTPMARGQLAAALAMLGERNRAQQIFTSAIQLMNADKSSANRYDSSFGSRLRDAAALLALGSEAGASPEQVKALVNIVSSEMSFRQNISTQEKTWMVMAAQALTKIAGPLSLKLDSTEKTGPLYRAYRDTTLESKSVQITNSGSANVKAVLNVFGNPLSPEPAISKGYKVERSYYTMSGQKVDPSRVVQNTKLITVLTVSEPTSQEAQLLVVDRLPAGFEIDNPTLVDSSNVESLNWLKQDVAPEHTEYRDDKFIASFNRTTGQPNSFSVAYIVRAVAPGKYMHPPASAEDMYRPERFGRSAFGTVDVTRP